MKKSIVLILFAGLIWGCNPQVASSSKTTITLEINAETLYNSPQNNQEVYVKTQCTLTDNEPGNSQTGSGIPGFQSKVWQNEKVKWVAKVDAASKTAGYKAYINQIQMKSANPIGGISNTEFFDKVILAGSSGQVIAKVKGAGIIGKTYFYNIIFSIEKNGAPLYFTIDPKLKGNN